MKKEIWLPKSETRVIVDDEGKVTLWDSMVMELKPIRATDAGFVIEKRDSADHS